MFKFGHRKTVLSKVDAFANNKALAIAELVIGKRVAWTDCLIESRPLTGQDGAQIYLKCTLRGHLSTEGEVTSTAAVMEFTVEDIPNVGPRLDKNTVLQMLLRGQDEYRGKWKSDDYFYMQPARDALFDESHRILSIDRKRLDELDLPVRLENYLYALRIRTLGHLKQWTRAQLTADMNDISLAAALDAAIKELDITLKT